MFSIIYTTHETQANAQNMADALLQKRLIACANIFPITSAYWWQNIVEKDGEFVAIFKTTNEKWPAASAEIERLHPYDVPCIMRLEVEANAAYEAWIAAEVKS